ncbi:MAG: hypothetical protein NZ958_06285 [Bacteroidia bacterium]|nr:hypothetical protein [Bacteroidia bacterium]MDW8088774.1 OstA-like protein [Bacteroidia bacterium]
MGWGWLLLQAARLQVAIERADALGGTAEVRHLKGNVWLRQDTLRLVCQEAFLYPDGLFVAQGGTQTFIGTSGTITAQKLSYNPQTHRLTYEGDVVATFPSARLSAPILYYDRQQEVLHYENGVLEDTTGTIQSTYAAYHISTEVATFAKQVVLRRGSSQALTDTLVYFVPRHEAVFPRGLRAWDTLRKDTLQSLFAVWQREKQEIFLRDSVTYRNGRRYLEAEALFYNGPKDSGWAFCGLHYRSRLNGFYAWADTAFWHHDTLRLQTNAALLLVEKTQEPTFIQAELLQNTDTVLRAAGKVELMNPPLALRCDTLHYDTLHKVGYFYGNVWLSDSGFQLWADYLRVHFGAGRPDSAFARGNLRVLLLGDSLTYFFHQVQADSGYAYWGPQGTLAQVYFHSRVQAIYYQRGERGWEGGHYVRAEGLWAQMDSAGQPVYLRLWGKPEGTFYPISYALLEKPLWLRGSRWLRVAEQPQWPFLMP